MPRAAATSRRCMVRRSPPPISPTCNRLRSSSPMCSTRSTPWRRAHQPTSSTPKSLSDPTRSTPMRERTVRILLILLGVPALVLGAWAAFAPRSFYEDFPGFGQLWVRPDGPFNEHLVRDVGELNLALAFVTLAAVVWCTPLLARVVAGAWLVEGIPHLVYHLRHTDPLASDAKVASIAGLAIVPVVAIVLLAMATDRGRGRSTTGTASR